jgi:hypothetical protein
MQKYRHIIFPAVMPLAFFILAQIPVEVIGCRNRGIMALLIAFPSGIAAIVTTVIGLRERMRGNPDASRWVVSALILTVPVVALIILA